MRHFLTLLDLSPEELNWLIQRAIELKQIQKRGEVYEPLKNRVLGMIFEKSSIIRVTSRFFRSLL